MSGPFLSVSFTGTGGRKFVPFSFGAPYTHIAHELLGVPSSADAEKSEVFRLLVALRNFIRSHRGENTGQTEYPSWHTTGLSNVV